MGKYVRFVLNQERHFHTESERRQLDGVLHDADANGWTISKHNRMKSRVNNLPVLSLVSDEDAAA